MTRVHILTENRTERRGLLAEHGLSLLIEHEGRTLLFDTGQTGVYLHNARRMGLDPAAARCVILSHGHYDHCGGLPLLARGGRVPPVYVRPSALVPRYAGDPGGGLREIGVPWDEGQRAALEPFLVRTESRTQIDEGVHLLSAIPAGPGEVSEGFYTGDPPRRDFFDDEQLLVIEQEAGLAVFCGCSHPGILACLRHVGACFPGRPVASLTAGMHLRHTGGKALTDILDGLWERDIGRMVPLHCTGETAICAIRERWGARCAPACAGDTIEL